VHVSQVKQASFRGTPDWTRPRLAPAGDRFAAVRWHDGAANVWVGASKSPMQLASDLGPWRLRDFHWGADGRGLILVLSQAGSLQRVLAWLDLRTRSLTPLTPDVASDAHYVGQVGGAKPHILIAVRQSPAGTSQLRAVTPTGAVLSEWQPPSGQATRWLATGTQAVAVCTGASTCTWWHTCLAEPAWSPIREIPVSDGRASRPLAFSSDEQTLFALNSADRDTVALVRMSGPDWSPEVISGRDQFDVTVVLMSPDGREPDLVTTTDPGEPQSALSRDAATDLARLARIAEGAPATITGRNSSYCLAEISFPVGGPAFVTFSRTTDAVSKPMARFTGFARAAMQPREPMRYRARDGLLITGFLTRPDTPPPWPAVLAVHGGPWASDRPQFDPWAQFLAAAGLCCIQVNYRGSRGFGKRFRDAGDRQWALAMQDDLVDVLQSAEVAGVIDTSRIAAIGHGYGGYAALMLATQAEVPLACVVAGSAPTDLPSYVASLPSLGGSAGVEQAARIGDLIDDREQLIRTSPVSRAADIGVPLLLFHGRQDARVPVHHAEALAAALERAGRPYDLTIYADEGHWYARPQNVIDCRAQCLEFLLTNLRAGAGVVAGP
jgi:acetyl esterase/lipase